MPYKTLIELDKLKEHFHEPMADVARKFGVCTTFFKRICRTYGIKRWPFRKVAFSCPSLILTQTWFPVAGTVPQHHFPALVQYVSSYLSDRARAHPLAACGCRELETLTIVSCWACPSLFHGTVSIIAWLCELLTRIGTEQLNDSAGRIVRVE